MNFREISAMFFEFALIGVSGSGKSDLANALATELGGVILSLDSLCVYKEINIASAKPDKSTLEAIKHFGVNLLSVNEHFNVALFFKEYERAKKWALEHERPLIIVGGTGFYLKALMSGLSKDVPQSESSLSNSEIYALLQQIDPKAKIAQNDTYRLKKWLGIYEQTGETPSLFLKKSLQKPVIKELKIFELTLDKDALRSRIQKRTQTMLNSGLIDEAEFLFKNYDNDLKPLNSIGLKECRAFLNGEITRAELPNLIITHTMQLAKRQRTFNKKFNSHQISADGGFGVIKKEFKA